MGRTYQNLERNGVISIAAADEHTFTGFSLKGKAVHVAANTPISCDLCHSIVKSCTASPAGACGK
jgi:hypothetical protein